MSCRLPTFQVMTGGIFGNMFGFFKWYCDTTESLMDSFFFSPFIVYIYIYTHMYLLVVLLLCCCLGLWWLHCSFCEVVELWFRASASPPKCSVSVLLWKHGTMCSERRLWWQPRVFSMEESRLELSKRYWIAALGVTFFLVDVVKQPLALYACILSTKI